MNWIFISIASLLFGIGCTAPFPNTPPKWLIPEKEVYNGGPGKDGIPAIDHPRFISAPEADFLSDTDLVVGLKSGPIIRAYPHKILDWHEIVNDQLQQVRVAITYCPLTGSAIGWNRHVTRTPTTFGVSGLLYNSNLIPYDRTTNSNWSQMLLKCVNGPLAGTPIKTIPVVETEWQTWKKLYPESEVLSLDTGYRRDYARYPYGNYKTSDEIFFPVANEDSRLPKKERVLGIIGDGVTKVYPISQFSGAEVVHDSFQGKAYIVFGSRKWNVAVIYRNQLHSGPGNLVFSVDTTNVPVIMRDNLGNRYSIFGEVVQGPNRGDQLIPAQSFISYWFAWAAFYPQAEIWKE